MTSKPQLDNMIRGTEEPLLGSFRRHLTLANKRESTKAHYIGATQDFLHFCKEQGFPDVRSIRREHVETWLESLYAKGMASASVKNRFVGCRLFYRWLVEEGDISRDPFARIPMPVVEETVKDIASRDSIIRTLTMLEKEKRWRDCAIVLMFYDCGMRATELADCLLSNLDLDNGNITLTETKGRRPRRIHIGVRVARYLDRYLRLPRKQPEYLFNGRRGKMTRSGVYEVVRRAFEDAGETAIIGPHDLRHTSASAVAGKMSESEMMALYGWTDPAMARHYARQAIADSAIETHKRVSPGDNLPRSR